ncbi:helix-turn-helix domain-containing protein [Lelliottia amnigena]|uniref:Helix-turn-helix domain-containing protein n=1 Tax=Lelliottia amnigena TaxID=61646 RepID=A0AAP2F0H9_LELAM|nr:helix-turn-helix domain-containing protein [Lelliottia amnigena]MBL5897833.1 helix-turn-helix domain-containing protein [Lelliottia amnigena]MBL5933345.1 helix-turn-helix domain-containing protein [Lelliottia amnigena]TCD17526.1 helix-turn-helix domain-containing protein [Lelliottia amnigena]
MKPEGIIKTLIHEISDPSCIRHGQERTIISLDNYEHDMTFILHVGTVAVHRSTDQLLLKFSEAPMIIGMNDLFNAHEGMYYQVHGEVKYEIRKKSDILALLDSKNLWKEAAYCYMYGVKELLTAHKKSAGLTTYELIRQSLMTLMAKKETLRQTINTCDYIQEKTHISRSRVMKILSDLKIGNYIEIERGVLIKINKLPKTY